MGYLCIRTRRYIKRYWEARVREPAVQPFRSAGIFLALTLRSWNSNQTDLKAVKAILLGSCWTFVFREQWGIWTQCHHPAEEISWNNGSSFRVLLFCPTRFRKTLVNVFRFQRFLWIISICNLDLEKNTADYSVDRVDITIDWNYSSLSVMVMIIHEIFSYHNYYGFLFYFLCMATVLIKGKQMDSFGKKWPSSKKLC